MKNYENPIDALNEKQIRSLVLLFTTTMENPEICIELGINGVTLSKWKKDKNYLLVRREMFQEIIEDCKNRLAAGERESIACLRQQIAEKNSVNASKAVLSYIAKMRPAEEMNKLQSELDKLKEIIRKAGIN